MQLILKRLHWLQYGRESIRVQGGKGEQVKADTEIQLSKLGRKMH